MADRHPLGESLAPAETIRSLLRLAGSGGLVERPDLLTVVTEKPLMHDGSPG
jgi:hypothetical protein